MGCTSACQLLQPPSRAQHTFTSWVPPSQALHALSQATDPSTGAMCAEAAVDCGNALCAWAALLPAGCQEGRAIALAQQAVAAYQHALGVEEDALTSSNLGDALVQLGAAQVEAAAALAAGAAVAAATGQPAPPPEQEQQLRREGMDNLQAGLAAYERSCSLTDSAAGDSLPDLLHNWGVGLYEVSKQLQVGGWVGGSRL